MDGGGWEAHKGDAVRAPGRTCCDPSRGDLPRLAGASRGRLTPSQPAGTGSHQPRAKNTRPLRKIPARRVCPCCSRASQAGGQVRGVGSRRDARGLPWVFLTTADGREFWGSTSACCSPVHGPARRAELHVLVLHLWCLELHKLGAYPSQHAEP